VFTVWKDAKRTDFSLFPQGCLVEFEFVLLNTVNMRKYLYQNARGTSTLDVFGGSEFLKLITLVVIDATKYVRIKVECTSRGNFHCFPSLVVLSVLPF
jgi:hypothetical protein